MFTPSRSLECARSVFDPLCATSRCGWQIASSDVDCAFFGHWTEITQPHCNKIVTDGNERTYERVDLFTKPNTEPPSRWCKRHQSPTGHRRKWILSQSVIVTSS